MNAKAARDDPREPYGRLVRETWCQWAREQPDISARSSWLLPWEDIDDGQHEVDMRIGESVAAAERERIAALLEQEADDMDTSDAGMPSAAIAAAAFCDAARAIREAS